MYAWQPAGLASVNAQLMQQQPYWQQYNYGVVRPPPPAETQPQPPPPPSTSLNPAPPVKPPQDEQQPPLPTEPPPPDAPPPPDDENVKNLQQQASQWSQQQQQWQKYQQDLVKYQQQQQQLSQNIPPHATPVQRQKLVAIHTEEQQFEQQYNDWVKQYKDWKEQNKNHPDRTQFEQYEQQFKQYEVQMDEKRADIAKRKQAVMNEVNTQHSYQPRGSEGYGNQQPNFSANNMNQGPRMAGPRGYAPSGDDSLSQGNFNQGHFNQGNQGHYNQGNRFSGPRGPTPGFNQGRPRGPSPGMQGGFTQDYGGPRGQSPNQRGAFNQGNDFGGLRAQGPGYRGGFSQGPRNQGPGNQEFMKSSDSFDQGSSFGRGQIQRGRGFNQGGPRGPPPGNRGEFNQGGSFTGPQGQNMGYRGGFNQGGNFNQSQDEIEDYFENQETFNDNEDMTIEDEYNENVTDDSSNFHQQGYGFRGRGRGGVMPNQRGAMNNSRGSGNQGQRYEGAPEIGQNQRQINENRGAFGANRGHGQGGRGGRQGPPSLMDIDTSNKPPPSLFDISTSQQSNQSGTSKPMSLLDLNVKAPANTDTDVDDKRVDESNSQKGNESAKQGSQSNLEHDNVSVKRPASALSEQSGTIPTESADEAAGGQPNQKKDRVTKQDFVNLEAMDMEAMGLPVNFGADAFDTPKQRDPGPSDRGRGRGGRGGGDRGGRGGFDRGGRGGGDRGRGGGPLGRGDDGPFNRGRGGYNQRGRGGDVRGRGHDTGRGRGFEARGRGFDARGRGRGRGAQQYTQDTSWNLGEDVQGGALSLFSKDQLDLLKKTADELKLINSQKDTLDMLAGHQSQGEAVSDAVLNALAQYGEEDQEDPSAQAGMGGRGRGRAVGSVVRDILHRSEVDPFDNLKLVGKSRKEKLLAIREMLIRERRMAAEDDPAVLFGDPAARLRNTLHDPLRDALAEPMPNPYRDPLRDRFREPFRDPLRDPLRDPARDPYADRMRDPYRDPVRDPYRDPMTMRDPYADPARDPLRDPYRDPARGPLGDPYRDPIRDPLRDPYRDPYADYPARDPYARGRSPPRVRAPSPLPTAPAQVIEYGHGGDDKQLSADRTSREGDGRSVTSRDEDLRSVGGDSFRKDYDDRPREYGDRPRYDDRRSPLNDKERRPPPDSYGRDMRGAEQEYDRGRDFDRDRNLDRERELDRNRDFDRGRDFDRPRDVDRGRDFERDRDFDRRHDSDRGRDFERSRELDRTREFDRPREFERGHEFDRDRNYRDREMRERRHSPPDTRRDFDRDRGRGREYERGRSEHHLDRPRDREGFDRDRHRVDDHLRDRSRDRDRDRLYGRESERFERDLRIKRDPFGRDITLRRDYESGRPRDGYDLYSKEAQVNKPKAESISVEDLFCDPGRKARPERIVVIIRGPSGAGKTYVSKLLKEKETQNGGAPPRVMSLDDYFMVENEKTEKDPDTGRIVKKTVLEYEYDPDMEDTYRQSFFKTFKKQVENCYFNFIIVDAVFDRAKHVEEFWSYAKSNGFQVYVAEVNAEASVCAKRNIHSRSLKEIERMISRWEEAPNQIIRLDLRSLLQDDAIDDVEMEDVIILDETKDDEKDGDEKEDDKKSEEEDEPTEQGFFKSKWDETTEEKLDKLDGLRLKKVHEPRNMEEFLQLADDYETRKSETGKKHVRWADIEEKKSQERMRDIGFVVGQTNWDKMMDDSHAERALNRTKFI